MLPDRLGSFEIKGVLGEGGSAVVYSAHDGTRDVALKVLHADLCLDERQVERFLEEANRMRRVDHRALVPVLGAGCLPGGRPYIVMPRLQGRTLAGKIAEAPVPLSRALALFEDVAFGVAALHAAGLVHRDIKPENVFWTEPEDKLVLLDLGIARDSAADPSTTTKAGFMRGTPAYMAPERLFGQPATILSDIYELGLLLCLMLTAKLPWDEGDAMRRVQPALRPADRALVPPGIEEALLEAMSFDLTKRPPSVAALLGRIRRGFANAAANTPVAGAPRTPMQAHTPQVIITPAAMAASTMASAQYDPTLFQPMTPSSPTAPSAQALLPGMTPPAPGFAPPAAPQPAPLVAPVPRRSIAPSVITFVLGAGVAAALAVGVGAWRGRVAASKTPVAEPPNTATATATTTASDIAPPVPTASVETSATLVSSTQSRASSEIASASATATTNGPIKEGYLPKSAIESRVRARIGAMKACIKSETERPNFQGARIVLNFWIGTGGNVTSASGKSGELPGSAVSCMLAQVRGISFPQPEGGPVNVIFPIRFTK